MEKAACCTCDIEPSNVDFGHLKMTIAITALVTFALLSVLCVVLGFISVIVAFLLGRTVPPARETCAKCIAGWRSKRGLRNRLLVAPLVMTLGIFGVFGMAGLTDTNRVRSKIADSTRAVVRSGGNCHRRAEAERVLLEIKRPAEIKALADCIAVDLSMPGMYCMCCGDMTFEFYRGEELHYSFSFHHGKSIRIKGSVTGDKELSLASRRRLSAWLERTGVAKALEKAREQESQRRKAELDAMEEDAQRGVGW